jgi:hypothetical protein
MPAAHPALALRGATNRSTRGALVRHFMLAYENNPNGECQVPSPPVKVGM